MTNEEILHKAILKAEDNGWKHNYWNGLQFKDLTGYAIADDRLYNLIFKHGFAKYFWGEELIKVDIDEWLPEGWAINSNPAHSSEETLIVEKWQYHLTKMVLEEEPIKYLKQFI